MATILDAIKETDGKEVETDFPDIAKSCLHGTTQVTWATKESKVCPLCEQQAKSKLLFDTLLEIKNKISRSYEILENIIT